jgi:CheB methylesterase
LAGTGSDGMRGVRAIRQSGAMVMGRDEAATEFYGMPRSTIATGLADYILAPEGRCPASCRLSPSIRSRAVPPAPGGNSDRRRRLMEPGAYVQINICDQGADSFAVALAAVRDCGGRATCFDLAASV